MLTLTAYETLEKIAEIENYEDRKLALRNLCYSNNAYAIIVQRCYHSEYNFDLPKGEIPETIATKSNHESPGPFFTSLRHWFTMTDRCDYKKEIKETQFINLYSSVAPGDADLLVGIKDKKLPWPSLSRDFLFDALPELFTTSKKEDIVEKSDVEVDTEESVNEVENPVSRFPEKSNREKAKEILNKYFGKTEPKNVISKIADLGVTKGTASNYYYDFKKEKEKNA